MSVWFPSVRTNLRSHVRTIFYAAYATFGKKDFRKVYRSAFRYDLWCSVIESRTDIQDG